MCRIITSLLTISLSQIVVTLGIIGSLATAMGSACSKYNKVLLPGVLATLADAKVTCLLHRSTQPLHTPYTTVDCQ